jgi:hypothetical protein
VEGKTAHLHLAIETGSEPIAGSLTPSDDEPRRFSGWIELVEAIEQIRSSNGSPNEPARAG